MITITRDELKQAVEAGITAAQRPDLPKRYRLAPERADVLRRVANTATLIASGGYRKPCEESGSGFALCPVAIAWPRHVRENIPGEIPFTGGYDDAMRLLALKHTAAKSDRVFTVTGPPT